MPEPELELLRRRLAEAEERSHRASRLVNGDGGPHTPNMSDERERLARLEGAHDSMKVFRPFLMAVLSIFVAVFIGGFAFMGAQLVRIDSKIETIPQTLRDEFRAMRAELSAQTSALGNAITAARQMGTGTPPVPEQPQLPTRTR